MNIGENHCLTESHRNIIHMPKQSFEGRQEAVNSNTLDNSAFGTVPA